VTGKPLWRCADCGREFVTPNMSHSCGRYTLERHFDGRPTRVRDLFDDLVRFVERAGPSVHYAEKTRIVFQVRGRFLAVVVRNYGLACHLWLKHRVSDERFHRVDDLAGRDFVHHFRLKDVADLDAQLLEYVRASHRVGSQLGPERA
jgi:hypothetical protein